MTVYWVFGKIDYGIHSGKLAVSDRRVILQECGIAMPSQFPQVLLEFACSAAVIAF